MSKTVYEVVAKTGEYKDQTGATKNRYQKLGSVIETKNGPMLKLDVIPLADGGWTGWAYLNSPKPKEEYPPDEDF
jgi:hypothetical protein